QRHPHLGRLPSTLSQELFGAGVDLHRREESSNAVVGLALDPIDELDRPLEGRLPGLEIPLPLGALAVAREPPSITVALTDVGAETGLGSLLGHVVTIRADLHHGGRATADELGHRKVDTGASSRLVAGSGARRQILEEAGSVELARPLVLHERLVER